MSGVEHPSGYAGPSGLKLSASTYPIRGLRDQRIRCLLSASLFSEKDTMSVAASPLVSTTTRSAEPVTREVIIGKLLATVDEMAIVLARASMSPVIYEVLDFACGICDGRGDLVAQTNGITVFTGTFSRQVHFIIERFGADMAPGDTFLTNDPFEGGTHACDFAVIRPVFAGGNIVAYAIAI